MGDMNDKLGRFRRRVYDSLNTKPPEWCGTLPDHWEWEELAEPIYVYSHTIRYRRVPV